MVVYGEPKWPLVGHFGLDCENLTTTFYTSRCLHEQLKQIKLKKRMVVYGEPKWPPVGHFVLDLAQNLIRSPD